MSEPAPSRIGILAYHFQPSREVGAKRLNALVKCLQEKGESLSIFSAFEGLEDAAFTSPEMGELTQSHLHQVLNRPSAILAFMVRARKALLPTSKAAAAAISVAISPRSADWDSVGKRSRLHRLFFDLLYIIDNKKRWAIKSACRIVANARRDRLKLIIASGPPMSSLVAAVIAGRRLRVPVILDLRDPIYGEDAKTLAGHGVPVQWGRRALERFAVRNAASVTTTSPTLKSRLQARYPAARDRISCIYNGYDDPQRPIREVTDHRLTIVYAGSLYMNRDPFPFLETLEDLLGLSEMDSTRVEVVFAGDCEHFAGVSLSGWIANRKCTNVVTIRPRLDADDLRRLYDRATLLLNFAEGQPMQIPAKTFELLALGREILTFCEPYSDTASVLNHLHGVTCVSTDDRRGLRALILDIYARHVSQGTLRAPSAHAISQYSRAAQNQRFYTVIRDTLDRTIDKSGRRRDNNGATA